MGKMKKVFAEKTLKRDFAAYLLCYVLGALVLSVSCSALLQYIQGAKVPREYVLQYITEEGETKQFSQESLQEIYESEGKQEDSEIPEQKLRVQKFVDEYGNTFYMNSLDPVLALSFEPQDEFLYDLLGIASGLVYPVVFVAGIAVTSRLFYKRKLSKPLEILSRAADAISNSDLDFEIFYERQDELGRLCTSFEKMRCTLRENNEEMWRQIEERKRLNAAFSHDLRTPLTVLKGQSEMLLKYAPDMSEEKIAETAEMMGRHIARLEHYVETMGDLQRLEDREVKRQRAEPGELLKQLQETGACIAEGCDLSVRFKTPGFSDAQAGEADARQDSRVNEAVNLKLDLSVVLQVYENLMANAVRYAKREIEVSLSRDGAYFLLTVADDGEGFSARDLAEATKPFYKAEKETGGEHFGMGLNICKVLCEKHGGYLKLKNDGGGCVTAAFA